MEMIEMIWDYFRSKIKNVFIGIGILSLIALICFFLI